MSIPGGDRIKETSSTSGTGSFLLTGAVSGEAVRAFGSSENGAVIRYLAEHVSAQEAEAGYGVYTHATRTLTRLYRTYPSDGAPAVNFSAGGLVISCTALARNVLPNFATSDPDEDDDITSGFVAGSIWINTAGPSVWICVDHTDGAAVWRRIDGAEGGGGLSPVDDDNTSVNIGAATDGTKRRMTSDSPKTATLLANAPVGTTVELEVAGLNPITVEVGSGAGYYTRGQDQSDTSPATDSFTVAGSIRVRCVENEDDESAVWVIEDLQGGSLPMLVGSAASFDGNPVHGASVVVESVSGTLGKEHIGKRLTTSGAITIPTTQFGEDADGNPAWWWGIVRLGGDHDISFNGNTLDVSGLSWATGDKLAITVTSDSTIEIERTAADDIVDESDFA